ncbi:MAG: hypothetical protein ACP5UH_02315 [Candidatus Micrarchaeia archaeon]
MADDQDATAPGNNEVASSAPEEESQGANVQQPQVAQIGQGAAPAMDKFSRSHLASIAIALVIIVVVFFAVRYITLPRTVAPVYTTPTTSVVYINLSKMAASSPNLLFGIPNASQYIQFVNQTFSNFTLGAGNITSRGVLMEMYGLNFTGTLILSPVEFAPNYTLVIPGRYKNYTYPIVASVFVFNESSPAKLTEFYDYDLHEVLGSDIALPVYNRTVYYASNFSVATNSGVAGYTYPARTSAYNLNVGIPGMSFAVDNIEPMYQTTDWFHVAVLYQHYYLLFSFFGVLGKFNQSTAISIAEHYVNATIR